MFYERKKIFQLPINPNSSASHKQNIIVRRGRQLVVCFIFDSTRDISNIVPVADIGSIAPYNWEAVIKHYPIIHLIL